MVPYTRLLERTLCLINNNVPHIKNDEDEGFTPTEENNTPIDDDHKDKQPIIDPARQISG